MKEVQNLREKFDHILNTKSKSIEDVLYHLHQFFFKFKKSKILYRYRDFDDKNYNLDSIKNEKMYFSQPNKFNDPHDSLVFIDSEKVDLKLGKHKKRIISEEDFVNHKKQIVDIACLCEEFDSTLMWAHYAKNHSGFVLEYDLSVLENNSSMMICPVIYSDHRFDSTEFYINFIKELIKEKCFEKYKISYKTSEKLDLLSIIQPFVYKSINWIYENEWRIIMNHKNDKGQPFFLDIKPTAIYMGDKIAKNNKEELIKISNEKNINIYQMFVDYSSFEYKLDHKIIRKK